MRKSHVRLELVVELIILLLIIVVSITTYNGLISCRNAVQEQYAQIENVLQARLEKVPDLINTVKSYASHEETIFAIISDAKSELQNAISNGDVVQIADANDNLTEALKKLNTIAESYPELTSSKLYIGLMDEIAESVNRVSQERRKYNQVVAKYNSTLEKFPEVIFSSMFGFKYAEYFEASNEAHITNITTNR